MILEHFLDNPDSIARLREVLGELYQIGFYSVLLELKQTHVPIPQTADLNKYALRAAYTDGYDGALRDLFQFFELYQQQHQQQSVKPTFGAAESLLQRNEITAEEYEQLTGRQPE